MRITKHDGKPLKLVPQPLVVRERFSWKRFLLALVAAVAMLKLVGCAALPVAPVEENLLSCQKENAFLQEQLDEAEKDLEACVDELTRCYVD